MFRSRSLLMCVAVGFALCVGRVDAEPPTTQHTESWVRPKLVGWASDSGHFSLDESKLRALFPDFDWTPDQIAYLKEHLARGDSRAAIVASVKPLVVSAFSDELDGVILVRFPDALVDQYSLSVGSQLIASWVYPRLQKPAGDIVHGPKDLGRHYNDCTPIVADFFSDSTEKLKKRKLGVSKVEWARVQELTAAAMERANGQYRSYFPLETYLPPELLKPSRSEK